MSAGKTLGLLKSLQAGLAIAEGNLLKFGADDDTVVPATAGTDLLIGIAESDASIGERVGVQFSGIADVKAGGTITRGAFVSSDANGKAVAAVAGDRVIGFATASAVLDDLVPVLVNVSRDRII